MKSISLPMIPTLIPTTFFPIFPLSTSHISPRRVFPDLFPHDYDAIINTIDMRYPPKNPIKGRVQGENLMNAAFDAQMSPDELHAAALFFSSPSFLTNNDRDEFLALVRWQKEFLHQCRFIPDQLQAALRAAVDPL